RQHGFRAAAARRVAVEHDEGHAREQLCKTFPHALGARANRLQHRAPAVGAPQRPGHPLPAVMAQESPAPVVDGPADAAAAATEVVAAIAAEEKGSEPSPRLEEDRLLPSREDLAQPLD